MRSLGQFDLEINTPKALANFSPGLERSDNLGINSKVHGPTLKGLKRQGELIW